MPEDKSISNPNVIEQAWAFFIGGDKDKPGMPSGLSFARTRAALKMAYASSVEKVTNFTKDNTFEEQAPGAPLKDNPWKTAISEQTAAKELLDKLDTSYDKYIKDSLVPVLRTVLTSNPRASRVEEIQRITAMMNEANLFDLSYWQQPQHASFLSPAVAADNPFQPAADIRHFISDATQAAVMAPFRAIGKAFGSDKPIFNRSTVTKEEAIGNFAYLLQSGMKVRDAYFKSFEPLTGFMHPDNDLIVPFTDGRQKLPFNTKAYNETLSLALMGLLGVGSAVKKGVQTVATEVLTGTADVPSSQKVLMGAVVKKALGTPEGRETIGKTIANQMFWYNVDETLPVWDAGIRSILTVGGEGTRVMGNALMRRALHKKTDFAGKVLKTLGETPTDEAIADFISDLPGRVEKLTKANELTNGKFSDALGMAKEALHSHVLEERVAKVLAPDGTMRNLVNIPTAVLDMFGGSAVSPKGYFLRPTMSKTPLPKIHVNNRILFHMRGIPETVVEKGVKRTTGQTVQKHSFEEAVDLTKQEIFSSKYNSLLDQFNAADREFYEAYLDDIKAFGPDAVINPSRVSDALGTSMRYILTADPATVPLARAAVHHPAGPEFIMKQVIETEDRMAWNIARNGGTLEQVEKVLQKFRKETAKRLVEETKQAHISITVTTDPKLLEVIRAGNGKTVDDLTATLGADNVIRLRYGRSNGTLDSIDDLPDIIDAAQKSVGNKIDPYVVVWNDGKYLATFRGLQFPEKASVRKKMIELTSKQISPAPITKIDTSRELFEAGRDIKREVDTHSLLAISENLHNVVREPFSQVAQLSFEIDLDATLDLVNMLHPRNITLMKHTAVRKGFTLVSGDAQAAKSSLSAVPKQGGLPIADVKFPKAIIHGETGDISFVVGNNATVIDEIGLSNPFGARGRAIELFDKVADNVFMTAWWNHLRPIVEVMQPAYAQYINDTPKILNRYARPLVENGTRLKHIIGKEKWDTFEGWLADQAMGVGVAYDPKAWKALSAKLGEEEGTKQIREAVINNALRDLDKQPWVTAENAEIVGRLVEDSLKKHWESTDFIWGLIKKADLVRGAIYEPIYYRQRSNIYKALQDSGVSLHDIVTGRIRNFNTAKSMQNAKSFLREKTGGLGDAVDRRFFQVNKDSFAAELKYAYTQHADEAGETLLNDVYPRVFGANSHETRQAKRYIDSLLGKLGPEDALLKSFSQAIEDPTIQGLTWLSELATRAGLPKEAKMFAGAAMRAQETYTKGSKRMLATDAMNFTMRLEYARKLGFNLGTNLQTLIQPRLAMWRGFAKDPVNTVKAITKFHQYKMAKFLQNRGVDIGYDVTGYVDQIAWKSGAYNSEFAATAGAYEAFNNAFNPLVGNRFAKYAETFEAYNDVAFFMEKELDNSGRLFSALVGFYTAGKGPIKPSAVGKYITTAKAGETLFDGGERIFDPFVAAGEFSRDAMLDYSPFGKGLLDLTPMVGSGMKGVMFRKYPLGEVGMLYHLAKTDPLALYTTILGEWASYQTVMAATKAPIFDGYFGDEGVSIKHWVMAPAIFLQGMVKNGMSIVGFAEPADEMFSDARSGSIATLRDISNLLNVTVFAEEVSAATYDRSMREVAEQINILGPLGIKAGRWDATGIGLLNGTLAKLETLHREAKAGGKIGYEGHYPDERVAAQYVDIVQQPGERVAKFFGARPVSETAYADLNRMYKDYQNQHTLAQMKINQLWLEVGDGSLDVKDYHALAGKIAGKLEGSKLVRDIDRLYLRYKEKFPNIGIPEAPGNINGWRPKLTWDVGIPDDLKKLNQGRMQKIGPGKFIRSYGVDKKIIPLNQEAEYSGRTNAQFQQDSVLLARMRRKEAVVNYKYGQMIAEEEAKRLAEEYTKKRQENAELP